MQKQINSVKEFYKALRLKFHYRWEKAKYAGAFDERRK
jgi:hypothetical protein